MQTHLSSLLDKIKAEYAEIRYEESTSTYFHWIGKELESVGTSKEKGGGVRTKGKAGWSFLSFNNFDNLSSHLHSAAKQSLKLTWKKNINSALLIIKSYFLALIFKHQI